MNRYNFITKLCNNRYVFVCEFLHVLVSNVRHFFSFHFESNKLTPWFGSKFVCFFFPFIVFAFFFVFSSLQICVFVCNISSNGVRIICFYNFLFIIFIHFNYGLMLCVRQSDVKYSWAVYLKIDALID